MSIAFDKSLAPATSAKPGLVSSDGLILLIAGLALLAVVCAVAAAPIALDGNPGAWLEPFGA